MNFIDTNPQPSVPVKKSSLMKKILVSLFVLVFLGSLGAAGYFYVQWVTLKKNPNIAAQQENQSLIDQVGKIILLPTGEQPTIATVNDLSALKGQTFFDNAKVGDKVLVYNQAKKAFLYDPTENKIINVSPIN